MVIGHARILSDVKAIFSGYPSSSAVPIFKVSLEEMSSGVLVNESASRSQGRWLKYSVCSLLCRFVSLLQKT